MRELREFKFVIQPTLLALEGGKVVGEWTPPPTTKYGLESLQTWIDEFPDDLSILNDKERLKSEVDPPS